MKRKVKSYLQGLFIEENEGVLLRYSEMRESGGGFVSSVAAGGGGGFGGSPSSLKKLMSLSENSRRKKVTNFGSITSISSGNFLLFYTFYIEFGVF